MGWIMLWQFTEHSIIHNSDMTFNFNLSSIRDGAQWKLVVLNISGEKKNFLEPDSPDPCEPDKHNWLDGDCAVLGSPQ